MSNIFVLQCVDVRLLSLWGSLWVKTLLDIFKYIYISVVKDINGFDLLYHHNDVHLPFQINNLVTWSENVACGGSAWSGIVIWLTNEKRVIKADTACWGCEPHVTCVGSCAFCCNAFMHSNQQSPDSRKFRRDGNFISSNDWAVDGSDMVAGVKSLL